MNLWVPSEHGEGDERRLRQKIKKSLVERDLSDDELRVDIHFVQPVGLA